jgi:hypothetical protein
VVSAATVSPNRTRTRLSVGWYRSCGSAAIICFIIDTAMRSMLPAVPGSREPDLLDQVKAYRSRTSGPRRATSRNSA